MTKAVENHKPVLVALESRKKESGEDGHVLQYYIVLKRSFKKRCNLVLLTPKERSHS